MILFPAIGTHGRLGNQLFQLAAMIAIEIETGNKAFLPIDIEDRIFDNQKSLLHNFKHACSYYSNSDYTQILNNCMRVLFPANEDLEYPRHQVMTIQYQNIILEGYPESELFFKKHKKEIKQRINLIDEKKRIGEKYIQGIRENYYKEKEIVAIHIRRGDLQEYTKEYDWNRMKQIIIDLQTKFFASDKYVYLYFVGGSHTTNQADLEWVKNTFEMNNNSMVCEFDDTISDFSTLISCDHYILMNRSTFSWWGAYLGTHPNKLVLVPKKTVGAIQITPSIFWSDEFTQVDMY